MNPEPNFEDMSFKPFTVNENSTVDPELDPNTSFFLKYFFFFVSIQSILL